jgi:hypothetical protein
MGNFGNDNIEMETMSLNLLEILGELFYVLTMIGSSHATWDH